jgi:PAS domain-containing protein
MQLRLRTKLTLVMTGLVLLMVAVLSGVFLAQLLQQTLLETDKRASDLAHQVFVQAQHALTEAAGKGLRPSSEDPDDVHDYVRRAFEINAGLQAQLEAAISSPSVYEVSIADDDGLVLISNDESLPGKTQARRPPLSQLVQSGFVQQVKVLRGPSKLYEYDYPFNMASKPFGEVRVVLSSGLLLNEMAPSLKTSGTIVLLALVTSALLAAVVSGATLAPLRDISAQLDRISAGQYDAPTPDRGVFGGSGDELGQVSRKITQVGQQLRGVHEIFSTLRENMNSVMAGLEDGLLLFTRDARAVMVSPAAEKFLGASSGEFLGRRAAEIFPRGASVARGAASGRGRAQRSRRGNRVAYRGRLPARRCERAGYSGGR